MDLFQAMRAFTTVVDERGITAAADRLSVSKAMVSRLVAQLEAHLGARLLNRTTRRISLTEAGSVYYDFCRDLLERNDEMEARLSDAAITPSGLLRVNAPVSFGSAHIAPLIPDFLKTRPHVRIELELVDRYVDLVEEGVDLAIRVGSTAPPTAIARKIGETRMGVVGAPALIEARGGPPETLADLADWPRLYYTLQPGPAWWRAGNGEANSAFHSNSGEAILRVARAGVGLALMPWFFFRDDLRTGRVVTVLEEECSAVSPIMALYPHRNQLPLKTRAFIDYLAANASKMKLED